MCPSATHMHRPLVQPREADRLALQRCESHPWQRWLRQPAPADQQHITGHKHKSPQLINDVRRKPDDVIPGRGPQRGENHLEEAKTTSPEQQYRGPGAYQRLKQRTSTTTRVVIITEGYRREGLARMKPPLSLTPQKLASQASSQPLAGLAKMPADEYAAWAEARRAAPAAR